MQSILDIEQHNRSHVDPPASAPASTSSTSQHTHADDVKIGTSWGTPINIPSEPSTSVGSDDEDNEPFPPRKESAGEDHEDDEDEDNESLPPRKESAGEDDEDEKPTASSNESASEDDTHPIHPTKDTQVHRTASPVICTTASRSSARVSPVVIIPLSDRPPITTPVQLKEIISPRELLARMSREHVTQSSHHRDDITSIGSKAFVTPIKRKLGDRSPQQNSGTPTKKRATSNRI